MMKFYLCLFFHQDERCSKLEIYPIFQKVYLERFLRKPEIDAFAEELKPHQVAFCLILQIYTILALFLWYVPIFGFAI
ncbi:COP9 signalosome complex subunit 4 [Olea europaea subsp. europaea]|uniref:COP9 signalosome complex subunit 4 n=1 Tax=Olea europaea subsp. europaea TaxID=158383 RepID=A0A8S0RCC2_OLEEU|nr:COP9 signalosome complex subunit 4 [Olea europaea subsp. europaea]